MVVKYTDNFSGAAQLLSAYGHGWLVDSTGGGAPDLDGSGHLRLGTTSGSTWAHNTTASATAPVLTATLTLGTDCAMSFVFRSVGSEQLYRLSVQFAGSGGGVVSADVIYNGGYAAVGTSTPLAGYAADTPIEVTAALTPTQSGVTLTVSIGQTQVFSGSDAGPHFVGPYYGGFFEGGSAASGNRLVSGMSFAEAAASSAPTVTAVTLTPSTATVLAGTTLPFGHAVLGSNNPDQGVTYALSPNVGTITSGGVYTPPAATSVDQIITVTATSTLDTSKSGTATVTVPALVLPSPGVLSIATPDGSGNDKLSFTAGTAGTYAIASVKVYSGTASGAETAMALATFLPGDSPTLSNPSGGFWYVLKVWDTQGNASVASNEVQGSASSGSPVTLGELQGLLGNLATVLLNNLIDAITTILSDRDAATTPQAVFDQLAAGIAPGLASNSAFIAMVAAQVLAGLNTAPSGTPTSGTPLAALMATSAKVALLGNGPTTTEIVAAMNTNFGPIKDAVGALTGYYDVTTVPNWTVIFNRAGAEVMRFPTAGRTKVTVPGLGTVGAN